jgi:hypothetical protein
MKTTKAEFNRFKTECLRLQGVLGLYDWTLHFAHTELDDNQAVINTAPKACAAGLLFSTNNRLVDRTPEDIAKHEMSHLIVARLRHLALQRSATEEQIEMEDERIANMISRLLPGNKGVV